MSLNNNYALAISYQNSVDVKFTFNSVATISVSGDLLIANLVPGNSSDSNIITIDASSNNIVGYDIKATVGSGTYNYTDLRLSSNDTTNVFSSLSANVLTPNAFGDDKWGYSYSNNDGSTWVSGNLGSTNNGYNGLPLYTNTGITIAQTSFASSTTTEFKIGAKASSSRISGDYTNIINFTMIPRIVTTNYTLNYLPNDGNNGADVTSMPNPATVSNTITENTNYTLSSSTPARTGYIFRGWCDGTVTTTSGVDSCSGTTYQPEDTYLIRNVGSNTIINLNAMWEEDVTYYDLLVTFDDVASTASVTFQNATYGNETVTTSGTTIQLAGGKTYTFTATATGTVCEINAISYGENITIDNYQRMNTYSTGDIVLNGDDAIVIVQYANEAPCGDENHPGIN